MSTVLTSLIELDGNGVAWISGANTKVIELVLDKIAYGWSPEEIHFQHPHLSLAQIHGALTYYYENQLRLDIQIKHRLDEAANMGAQASDPDFRRRLVELKRSL